jgi:hypothetical protein
MKAAPTTASRTATSSSVRALPARSGFHRGRFIATKSRNRLTGGASSIDHSVPAQYQCLDREQQGLNPQQQRVHEAGGVDDMQPEALQRTDLA